MRIARFQSGQHTLTGQLVSGTSARVIEGSILSDFRVTDRLVQVDRLLAPIVPTDLLCIGLNYRAHAIETKSEIPENPMLFIKASNALSDPAAPIVLPVNSDEVDYEAELVVVMKQDCRNVSREQALNFVLGYTCGNDVSARDWQKKKNLNGGQFARGKSFDTFAPIGPWIVTSDEIPDPNALRLRCIIDGLTLQDSTTADMIFDVPSIISSLSSTMTIRAGAVIFTGTPSGVGAARTPPRFLKPGDNVTIEIEKIGALTNPVANR
jgi:2-keto-4-pentenoate hydratase/2-oxohepta-3-ene-1,7-dioic acid hydratase in catechol pathway